MCPGIILQTRAPIMITNTSIQGVHGLFLAGVLLTALLYRRKPPVTTATVYAIVPWLIVGSALHVLGVMGSYPSNVNPLFAASGAYLTAFLFIGVIWVILLELSPLHRSVKEIPYYLAAMGTGAAIILLTVLLWQGTVSDSGLIWLFVILAASVTIGAVTPFLIGFWYPDLAFYSGFTGGLVVFGFTLRGLSKAIGTTTTDAIGHTQASAVVRNAAYSFPTVEYLGATPDLVWPAVFVLMHIFIAVVLVAALTPFVQTDSTKGNLLLGFVAAIGLIPGSVNLLLMVIGA